MEISEIDQEVNDYDWFAVDRQGHIGHFASNGGMLPASVSASAEDLQTVVNYFKSLKNKTAYKLVPSFYYPEDIKSAEQKAIFLSSFADYSSCGLYSFDRNEPNYRRDLSAQDYWPITQPNTPLPIPQVPEVIRVILNRLICNCDFSESKIISLTQFQNS